MSQMEEVIAAFVDDERVDADALKRALALPEGRDYLVDLLAMRELVAVPATTAQVPPAPVTASRRWTLAAAAAVLLSVSAAGGYFAGARVDRGAPMALVETTAPPILVAPDTASVAPQPTTVIRLQPGVDWTERSGGGN